MVSEVSAKVHKGPWITRFEEPWKDRLDELVGVLDRFVGETEGEFLEVGKKLKLFHDRAGDLSRRATAVADRLRGEEIEATVVGFQRLLDRISAHAEVLEEESVETEQGLRKVLDLLAQVTDPVSGFKKIVKTMTVLGLSTKIETAKHFHGDSSFDVLADDLVGLAAKVARQAEQILEQLGALDDLVRRALQKVLDLKAGQRRQTREIMAHTRSGIATLSERHRLSSAKAKEIAALSEDISRRIGEVVASIQMHDLTRQQVDHVKMALKDMSAELTRGVRGGDPAKAERGRAFLGEVCRLQAAQVRHSRDELVKAVLQIQEELRGIAASTLAMANETQQMAGTTGEAGTSFFAEMEKGMAAVTAALNESAGANRESASTIRSLAASVAHIGDFLQEIEKIGAEMKVLALNAGIKAARVYDGGGGLTVIAEAIQQLSGTALVQTAGVSRQLRAITFAADHLRSGGEDRGEGKGSEAEGVLSELEELLGSFRGLNQDVVAHFKGMDEEGRSLAEEIEKTVSTLTVHQVAGRLFQEVLEGLENVAAAAGGSSEGSFSPGGQEGLFCDLLTRYTMHSERKIHYAITSREREAGKEEKKTVGTGKKGAELGDNVELF